MPTTRAARRPWQPIGVGGMTLFDAADGAS
jgi:hypothetical protein